MNREWKCDLCTEWNFCSALKWKFQKMNGVGRYYTEWGNPGLERQTNIVSLLYLFSASNFWISLFKLECLWRPGNNKGTTRTSYETLKVRANKAYVIWKQGETLGEERVKGGGVVRIRKVGMITQKAGRQLCKVTRNTLPPPNRALSYSFGWPETYHVDQTVLELMDIFLPLPLKSWD